MSKVSKAGLITEAGVRLPGGSNLGFASDSNHTVAGSRADIVVGGDASIPAVTGTFSNGVLSVFGDASDNTVVISRTAGTILNPAGNNLINGGAVPIAGGPSTVANTSLIQVFGQAGADVATLDETNGVLPKANMFGGAGDDVLTGGSGNDRLFGQSGNDVLDGKGGNDFLFGGADNDVLAGDSGNDQVFGEGGNDRMVWNPGDGNDTVEGGADNDTAEANGGDGSETFAVTANGARVRFNRLGPAPAALDIGITENLVINANGGDDVISASGNLATLINLTLDGGAGNDTILGGNGADLPLGGNGSDVIDGQQGNDVALLGAGDDRFQWDPGDDNDVVEGQDGTDTMLFNGSGFGEIFQVSANGERVLFTRNVGNVTMDLNDVEVIDLNALGGQDSIVVNDLGDTDVTEVRVDLAGVLNGTAGDGQIDAATVNGTAGGDTIQVFGSGTSLAVTGMGALVTVGNAEGANDRLVINGLGGDDTISAATLPAGVVKLTIDGGAGDDTLIGGGGADFVDGGNGNDLALLGAGNDRFFWAPGDGNDTVEGQGGTDTLEFRGAKGDRLHAAIGCATGFEPAPAGI
jgi:Ca2+-binding RTX toxin-like protein